MDILVSKSDTNKRLDKFLKETVFSNDEITRGEIARQIKAGNIRINNKIVKPSYVLRERDKIEINLPKKEKKLAPNKNIKVNIIYQDKNIIVINKPAGIQVHPDSREKKNTLANALVNSFPEIKNVGDSLVIRQVQDRPGIVHRLDKDTSGVLVIARNQESFNSLKKKFSQRKIQKKYLAIVWGHLDKKAGIIDKPLARAANYKKQVVAGKKTRTKVRDAMTEYKVIKEGSDYSLLEVFPKTGRMHQIRVHLASIGHPVIGDRIYKAKSKINKAAIKRQLLHAAEIKFSLEDQNYSFQADLPDDFREFLRNTKQKLA